ncbi:MAG: hypothetical protein ACREQM_02795, partial [Candidatus Dormibacteraceae bacterium]
MGIEDEAGGRRLAEHGRCRLSAGASSSAQRQAEHWTGLAGKLGSMAEDLAEDPSRWVRKKTVEGGRSSVT